MSKLLSVNVVIKCSVPRLMLKVFLGGKIPSVSKSRVAPRERMSWEPGVTEAGQSPQQPGHSPKIPGNTAGLLLGSIDSPRHGEVMK